MSATRLFVCAAILIVHCHYGSAQAPTIRLTGGETRYSGRLEVFVDGRWGTVCRTSLGFSRTEADVACRQLQFGPSEGQGFVFVYTRLFANLDDTLPIVMGEVSCTSTSSQPQSLQTCTFFRDPSCSHRDDVGLRCSDCSLFKCNDGQCVDALTCNGVRECRDGTDERGCTFIQVDRSIRLVGGVTPSSGRLEVLVDGNWGTVCSPVLDGFSKAEADVACKQLQGFGQASGYGRYYEFTTFSANLDDSLPIVIGDVSCISDQRPLTIQACDFSTYPSCTHQDDISLQCTNCSLYSCEDGQCINAERCNGIRECRDGTDEDILTCFDYDFYDDVSDAVKIGISVGVVVMVLFIAVPIAICVGVLLCTTGICARNRNSRQSPSNQEAVASAYTYNPASAPPPSNPNALSYNPAPPVMLQEVKETQMYT